MPSNRASDQLFAVRVRALVERDGRRAIAERYGVSERTVRRWSNAESRPQDASIDRSIVRRGRAETGAVVQLGGGRFDPSRTVYNRDAIAFVRRVSERRQQTAQAAMRNAITPAERAMASALPTRVSVAEARNFDRRLENLEYATLRGFDADDFFDYFGYEDDWDAFRSSYEQMAG